MKSTFAAFDRKLLPAIEELIPFRGTMLLLDRMVEYGEESAVCEYAPRDGAWYVDERGDMPAWVGIELMAQTIAAYVGMRRFADGLPQRQGALLGTRRYRANQPRFERGQPLKIVAREVLRDPGGLGAYECEIWSGDREIASAMLKVYEPGDFGEFVKRGQS